MPQPPELLITRIRGEFREMPGLHLTLAQARRLWDLDSEQCRAVLQVLLDDGFLSRTKEGAFVARSSAELARRAFARLSMR